MKDLLLHVPTYPDPSPPEVIDQAVRFAAGLGARLTVLAVQADLRASSNYLASRLVSLGGLIAEQEAKSLAACRLAERNLEERLAAHGVAGEAVTLTADPFFAGDHIAIQARTRDLCLVPLSSEPGGRSVAEAVVFGSGRPVIVFQPGVSDLPANDLRSVTVAWDGGRAASVALGHAIPLLARAAEVRVLTVLNDKAETRAGQVAEVVRHLRVHGIAAVVEEIDADGRKAGRAIAEHLAVSRPDLLVMGAYGRTRMRDFILGGVTEEMLKAPAVPIFMAH